MGATNTTANYSLSQFVSTDKPAWLQDYNGDMLKIDTGINAAKVAADSAALDAGAAQSDATAANTAITGTITPAITALQTTVGNQGGAINTINSLIGNGTPTTTDQTIIGAINEINAKVNENVICSITVTGTETTAQAFERLINQTTISDMKNHAKTLKLIGVDSAGFVALYSVDVLADNGDISFSHQEIFDSTSASVFAYSRHSNVCHFTAYTYPNNTITDLSNVNIAIGYVLKLIY